MKADRLFSLLSRNHTDLSPQTLGRLLFLIQSSVWSSLFAAIERLRFGKSLEHLPVPENPIFIIGHWRTGTTLLFKLMSLDKRFISPTLFQVAEPDSILVSQAYYRTVMNLMVGKTRPMDNVKTGPDEPQEDEYAVFRLTVNSALERLIFPEPGKYFLNSWISGNQTGVEKEDFRREISHFFSRVMKGKQGILLSKNPFHSFRITMLREIFPGARFIRMHRHPFDVVPSTRNMWDILQKQNTLNGKHHHTTTEEVCGIMKILDDTVNLQCSDLSPERYVELKFEDLERDPLRSLQNVYDRMNLEFSSSLMNSVRGYFDENKDFRKNSFSMPSGERESVSRMLKDYMEKHSYF